MVNKDLFAALDELEANKGIKKEFFLETLEAALAAAYKKNYGEARSIEVKITPEKSKIEFFAYKTVVEAVEDPDTQVSLEDAQRLKKSIKIGDTLKEEITPKDFGRIAAGTAKQVIVQKLREAERSMAFGELENKVDSIINGVVRRVEGDAVYVELSGTTIEGVMMTSDQIPNEKYTVGARIKVYVKKLREGFNGVQAIVSRA